ncbi:MAG: stage III sporulation AC/AD family protein [Eubacterium sp.]|nr:stage III sporulation AC/AD family protein [Eubacterium sp.]MDE6155728.1 stage III sporulation AC/AD family protein [Eubacterium sp.]
MIKLAVIVLISLLLIIFLKDVKREFALILTIACAIILFIYVAEDFFNVFEKIYSLSSGIGNINSYVSLMMKILGISLISQFVVDLCRDAGENALASQTEIASKVIILIMTLPLFESVINIIIGLLK